MKRLLISTVALFVFFLIRAQNIGIGITTPRAKLHVFQGASGNLSPYPPLVVENNGHTYVNLLSPDANERGILFGNSADASRGGIVYNNTNTLDGFQFRTAGNQTRMIISSSGNVGIGTLNPTAPLGFSTAFGKKITLYPSTPGDYGFGINAGLLQIYTDNSTSDIAFGYDQGGGNLAEKFRFKGNGTFVVNGNAGNPGQVLQSNGNGTSPSWTTPNNTVAISTTTATLVTGSSAVTLPFGHTFTTNTNAQVLVNFCFQVSTPSCFACDYSTVILSLSVDGAFPRSFWEDVPNDREKLISGIYPIVVGPGTHTITWSASHFGPDIYVGHGGLLSHVVYQLLPQ